jgi:uncharacterized protein (TIGR02058 family)
MVLEFGMGVDVHGDDSTKVARRAVFDAMHHSSLPMLGDIEAKGGRMIVEAVVGVPNPDSVDLAAVKAEFPHGDVTVRAVAGGLKVAGTDAMIACAQVMVSVEYPE